MEDDLTIKNNLPIENNLKIKIKITDETKNIRFGINSF